MPNTNVAPENGACKGYPVDWWFPVLHGLKRDEMRAVRADIHKAKSICASCDVSDHCLEYSLKHEPWGIWGGKDEQERAEIRYNRGILLSREGRINFAGIGLRNANGDVFQGRQ